MIRKLVIIAGAALLAGCGTTMREIGREPALSPVGGGPEPASQAAYQYPDAPAAPLKRFSLWNDRQSRLFTDPRALSAGDILTVRIEIDDKARFENESERNRSTSRSLGGGADLTWFGVGTAGEAEADIGSSTSTTGAGATARSEKLELSVAAVVTDVLPNGNLIIQGSQEVRVNAELRILTIAGIVRPSDIGA